MAITLAPTTNQEAFDHVVRYLSTKKGRAGEYIDNDDGSEPAFACQYHSPNGPCAIGSMVTEDEQLELDARGAEFGIWTMIDEGLVDTTCEPELIVALQGAHDHTDNWTNDGEGDFVEWEELALIARRFNLDTTVLTEHRKD